MSILQVPVTKGKGSIEIDADKLPIEVYEEALLQGLKVLANRGTSKITKEAYPDEAEMKATAMAKAEEQVALMMKGEIKFTGKAKSKKASGAVMTEARRLAKNVVKDELKKNKIKISHVDAKDITAAANALIDEDPSFIAQAEANLSERAQVPVKIDVAALVKINPKKKAADEAKKAAEKANKPLSATQAGKTKPATKKKGDKAPSLTPQQTTTEAQAPQQS